MPRKYVIDEDPEKKSVISAFLSPEHNKAYDTEAKRISQKCQYRFHVRGSDISLLMMYLIGQEGLPIDEALGWLEKKDSQQIYDKLGEILDQFDKTADLGEEAMARYVGQLHRKFFDKLLDYEIPANMATASAEETAAYLKKLNMLSGIVVDCYQDTESLNSPRQSAPATRQAYYDGIGGEVYATLSGVRVNSFFKNIGGLNESILKTTSSLAEGAESKKVFHEFCRIYGGKKVGALPTDSFDWYLAASDAIRVFGNSAQTNPKAPEAFEAYLNGDSDTYPGMEGFEQRLQSSMEIQKKSVAQKARDAHKALSGIFFRQFAGHFDGLSPQQEADLRLLPKEAKTALRTAFESTFGTLFSGSTVYALYERGQDEFDLIMTEEGVPVRELVRVKYGAGFENLSPQDQRDILTFETMKMVSRGERKLQVKYHLPGTQELSDPVEVRSLPAVFRYELNEIPDEGAFAPISLQEAEAFLADPAALVDDSPIDRAVDPNPFENFFQTQKPLMKANGLDLLDLIYVDHQSLRELYETTYKAKLPSLTKYELEKTMLRIMTAEVIAGSQKQPPKRIFLTALTNDDHGLKRTAIPIQACGKAFEQAPVLNEQEDAQYAQSVVSDRAREQLLHILNDRFDEEQLGGEQLKIAEIADIRQLGIAGQLLLAAELGLLEESEQSALNEFLDAHTAVKGLVEEKLNLLDHQEKELLRATLRENVRQLRMPDHMQLTTDAVYDLRSLYQKAHDTNDMDAYAKTHINGANWNRFEAALKGLYALAREYEAAGKKTGDLKPSDRKALQERMNRVRAAAEAYLADKGDRPRKSDMGKERYKIALAALSRCQRGTAYRTLQRHNEGFDMEKRTGFDQIEETASTRKAVDPLQDVELRLEELRERAKESKAVGLHRICSEAAYLITLRNHLLRGALSAEAYEKLVDPSTVVTQGMKIQNSNGNQIKLIRTSEQDLKDMILQKNGAMLIRMLGGADAMNAQVPAVQNQGPGHAPAPGRS